MHTIMVVDDDAQIRALLEKFFRRSGFTVISVSSGMEAIGIFRQGTMPDLVIFDIKMPHGSGLDVLHEMRRMEVASPAILLTGTIDAGKYADMLKKLGLSEEDICYKPIDLFALLGLVKKRLASYTGPRGKRQVIAQILLVDDEPEILFFLERMLAMKGFNVTVANGGKKALELIALGLKVDLMIIDKKMPDIDGLTVLQELAKQKRTMPVIFMTGSLGVDALAIEPSWPNEIRCLTKPTEFNDLLAAICAMLKITAP